MKATHILLVLVVAGLVATPCANAQLTVSTDKTEYRYGENVRITIHNAGPTTAMFASVPFYAVRRVSDGECFYGCVACP